MKNQQKSFIPLLTIILGLIIAGGVYFSSYKKEQQNEPIQVGQNTEPSQIENQNSSLPNQISDWKTYLNTKYNFQLNLTDAYRGYKVFHSEGSQGVGAPEYFDISMPTSDTSSFVQNVTDPVYGYASVLEIIVIDKTRRAQGTLITQDNTNNYSYVINANLPNDLKNVSFDPMKVISTFKFTK